MAKWALFSCHSELVYVNWVLLRRIGSHDVYFWFKKKQNKTVNFNGLAKGTIVSVTRAQLIAAGTEMSFSALGEEDDGPL